MYLKDKSQIACWFAANEHLAKPGETFPSDVRHGKRNGFRLSPNFFLLRLSSLPEDISSREPVIKVSAHTATVKLSIPQHVR